MSRSGPNQKLLRASWNWNLHSHLLSWRKLSSKPRTKPYTLHLNTICLYHFLNLFHQVCPLTVVKKWKQICKVVLLISHGGGAERIHGGGSIVGRAAVIDSCQSHAATPTTSSRQSFTNKLQYRTVRPRLVLCHGTRVSSKAAEAWCLQCLPHC